MGATNTIGNNVNRINNRFWELDDNVGIIEKVRPCIVAIFRHKIVITFLRKVVNIMLFTMALVSLLA